MSKAMPLRRTNKLSRTYSSQSMAQGLAKTPSGIQGLDEITQGGLPSKRTTLIAGGPGTGKTLLAMEFLVRGITEYGEPGVFIAFEENIKDLTANVVTLGFDLTRLMNEGKLYVDHIEIDPSEIVETGEYDLEGLFIRIGEAIKQIHAKRVVIDTLEALFSSFKNAAILRSEIQRLFSFLKARGVTSIVTGEKGEASITRYGLEEYISDCVIILDHRISEEISTRRIRVAKYRGSLHGTNEYPFLIEQSGISILPITSIGLMHKVSSERLSSGISDLDEMLGTNKGFFRGSSILVSGIAGTGKSSITAHFAHAAARRGERVLYNSFEESPDQIIRNMRSIGIDLQHGLNAGLLSFYAERPTSSGLEMHLLSVIRNVDKIKPSIVIMDPITNFISVGSYREAQTMLTRLIDYLKQRQITLMATSLLSGTKDPRQSRMGVSSLIDTWILLELIESSGERNRLIHVLKARGIDHSNQVREFLLTKSGIKIIPPYLGPAGVLTGSARLSQEAKESLEQKLRQQRIKDEEQNIADKRKALEAQILKIEAQFNIEERKTLANIHREQIVREKQTIDLKSIARTRGIDFENRENIYSIENQVRRKTKRNDKNQGF